MSYDSKAIEVMIASPNDVNPERQIVRDVISTWNAVNSRRQGRCLMPVGWETHSAPSMDGAAQDVINEQVLEGCDLLVGIFWTRVGSRTGKSISGSVEEIERHMAEGKPVMLYFSSTPVAPDNLDQDQMTDLSKFKEWAMSKGLVATFTDRQDFREKFSSALGITMSIYEDAKNGGGAVVDGADEFPDDDISEDAVELLVAAIEGGPSVIIFRHHLQGTGITAGTTAFVDGKDQREIARWQAASDELSNGGFTRDMNEKGEMYEVTHKGYKLGDAIISSRSD